MQADFAASTLGGNVANLNDSSERAVSGMLTIATTSIDRTADASVGEFQFMTPLTGTMTDADGVVFGVSAQANGDILGPNGEALGFLVSGTSTSTAFGVESFDGVGLAKR